MKKLLLYLLLSALLVSCGVKKHAAETSAVAAEPVAETAPADTLPEFLKEFANDSTFHINWAYGIPFIIDDSVPMLLPPIDKNPQGYVSSPSYKIIALPTISARNTYGDGIFACEIVNPMDSLPWLNKCLNGLRDFAIATNKNLEPTHQYAYVIKLININNQYLFNIVVLQEPCWLYWHKDYHERLQSKISYYFNCEGNLVGKMHMEMPVSYNGHQQTPQRSAIPNYNKFHETYFSDASITVIGSIVLVVIFPNSDYLIGD